MSWSYWKSNTSSSSFPIPCYLPVSGSSVHLLNPFLSFANLSISLTVFPFCLPKSSITSSHVFLGHPLPLFPIGLAPDICLGFLSSAILITCPYHRSSFCLFALLLSQTQANIFVQQNFLAQSASRDETPLQRFVNHSFCHQGFHFEIHVCPKNASFYLFVVKGNVKYEYITCL